MHGFSGRFSGWILVSTILCLASYACQAEDQRPPPQQQQLGNSTMKISFVRTGGIAGLRLATAVDSATLSSEEAAQLQKLIVDAQFFTLPARIKTKSPGADRFQYTVTVETPDQQHTVTVDEGAAPQELRPLLNWLTTAAKTPKP